MLRPPRSHQSRTWGHHGAGGWKPKERLEELDEEEKGDPTTSAPSKEKGSLDTLEVDSAASALALLETGSGWRTPPMCLLAEPDYSNGS